MAYKTEEYPSWSEISGDLSRSELLSIIEVGFDVGLDQAIQDYIKDNYDPVIVDDIDAAYEAMRDDRLTED